MANNYRCVGLHKIVPSVLKAVVSVRFDSIRTDAAWRCGKSATTDAALLSTAPTPARLLRLHETTPTRRTVAGHTMSTGSVSLCEQCSAAKNAAVITVLPRPISSPTMPLKNCEHLKI